MLLAYQRLTLISVSFCCLSSVKNDVNDRAGLLVVMARKEGGKEEGTKEEGKEVIHGTKTFTSFLFPLKSNERINTFMAFLGSKTKPKACRGNRAHQKAWASYKYYLLNEE